MSYNKSLRSLCLNHSTMMGSKGRGFFQQEKAPSRKANWVIMESCYDDASDSSLLSVDDVEEDNSISSPCSSKSSSTSSMSTLSDGPLYELSELMLQLPIRRGLSKYYQGKSESFGSLASVKSSEDLRKKLGCLERKKLHSPKAIISKKSTIRPSSFSPFPNFRPSLSIQKNF